MKKKPKKVTGKKKNFSFLLNFGKVIMDLGKLCFASLVLGVIIRGEISQETLLSSGIIASAIGVIIGIWFVSMFEEK